MKLSSLIMLLLVVKTKASFFDDFRGAMYSVQNAFGKLLNDVVSDVKTTVHCSILAMEKVLALNGIMSDPFPNNECYKDDNNVKFNIDTKKTNGNSEKDVAQDIHSTISKVNESLGHILDNTGHERIQDVKRVLKHESNRLMEVSSLLRKELDKISQRIKREFQNIDLDPDKTSLESVSKSMKTLYEMEKNDKNASKEIGEVLNEALNVLHINTNSEVKSDEEKINVIMKELEKESTNNKVSNDTVYGQLSQSKTDYSASQNNVENKLISGDILKNVKDITTNDKVLKEVAEYITEKSSSSVTSTSSEKTVVKDDVVGLNTNLDGLSVFNLGEKKNDHDVNETENAMDIFKDASDDVEDVMSLNKNLDDLPSLNFGETESEDEEGGTDDAMDILKDASDDVEDVMRLNTNLDDLPSFNFGATESEDEESGTDNAMDILKDASDNVEDVMRLNTNLDDLPSFNFGATESEDEESGTDDAMDILKDVSDNVEDVMRLNTNLGDLPSFNFGATESEDEESGTDDAMDILKDASDNVEDVMHLNTNLDDLPSFNFGATESEYEEGGTDDAMDILKDASDDVKDVMSHDTNLDDLSSFSFGETESEDEKGRRDEVMDIFKEAAETDALFEKLFTNETGANVFENPNLVNFGK